MKKFLLTALVSPLLSLFSPSVLACSVVNLEGGTKLVHSQNTTRNEPRACYCPTGFTLVTGGCGVGEVLETAGTISGSYPTADQSGAVGWACMGAPAQGRDYFTVKIRLVCKPV